VYDIGVIRLEVHYRLQKPWRSRWDYPRDIELLRHWFAQCVEIPVHARATSAEGAEESLLLAIQAFMSAAEEEGVLLTILEEIGAVAGLDSTHADEGYEIALINSDIISEQWKSDPGPTRFPLPRPRHPTQFLTSIGCRALAERHGFIPIVRDTNEGPLIQVVVKEAFESGDLSPALRELGFHPTDFDQARNRRRH
jgi:hypothetical protein